MRLRPPRSGIISDAARRAQAEARAQRRLRELELTVLLRLDGLLQGDYRGFLMGSGTEAGESREYRVGDDVRRMDWSLTARTGVAHVRDTIADREVEAWIVIDRSGSLRFGTGLWEKWDIALGMVAAVGFLTARAGNRVGAVAFGDGRLKLLPPRFGQQAQRALIWELARDQPPTTPGLDGLGPALEMVGRVAHRRGVVVVVSDFLDATDWERPLRALRARHELVAVELLDPRELEIPAVGVVTLVDVETGRRLEVQTNSTKVREAYAAGALAQRTAIAGRIARSGADHLVLRTDGDWVLELARYVLRRKRALRVGHRLALTRPSGGQTPVPARRTRAMSGASVR